jgi:hypothetical protein
MVPGVFRIVLGLPFRNDLLLYGRLILNKLDIRHLRGWRRRHYKEECQDEAREHKREVEDIRPACRLRHLNYILRVYMAALNHSRVVVRVTHRKGNKRDDQPEVDERHRRSQMNGLNRLTEDDVRLHVIRDAEVPQRFQNRVSENDQKEQ